MILGVTVGKFYPFHKGHDYLIREAKKKVDRLIVLACYKKNQAVAGSVRADWIRFLHPDAEVIEVLDDLPEAPEPWAQRTLEVLSGRKPDIAFTSEDYGEPWAKLMGSQYCTVDRQRLKFPISGTQLRSHLAENWQMLTPPAKAYFAKRVCVLGVESSGTTTLARSLAQHYRTVWVPEYGRCYWEGRQYSPDPEIWDSYEFVEIAKKQAVIEDHIATRANKVVICDTDPLATCIWHKRYVGSEHPTIEQIADSRRCDLYILTQPDFGFLQDGTRESEHLRMTMHQWFVEVLQKKGKRYITVGGTHDLRMSQAIRAIDSVLVFEPLKEVHPNFC
jgi:NadR type nicotinamide-nucleotide adenylyltransferase